MKRIYIIFLTFFLQGFIVVGQTISGKVEDKTGNPIVGATVLLTDSQRGTASDINGVFEMSGFSIGKHQLIISAIGYQSDTVQVVISDKNEVKSLKIILQDHKQMMEEVVVTAKSESTLLREQAYAIEVIESKKFKNLSTSANDILGRVSGVNIRQSGGLGSTFTLSLNGLSGNQVRIFLDGVPMDYFGSSLSLNNFSANVIERIEVYKGVVPVHLSSDALGGAINVITNSTQSNYIDASYGIGSFGTHVLSLNAQYRHKKGFTARIKSFYNQADNNYKVPIHLVNFETGKPDEKATWVERFHDAYQSKMIWAEVGVTHTKFADQLMAGIIYSNNHNEIQQPANAIGQAKIPYGEVATEEEKIITNFTYSKKGLLSDRLSINAYGVAVFAENIAIDTASVRYDWFGNRVQKINNSTGEVENRKTLLTLETKNILANTNAEYQLKKNHSITLNYSLNSLNLSGSDPFKTENNTQFSNPSDVTKQVLAASYTNSFFNKKLKTTLFSKYYDYKIKSLETDYGGDDLSTFSNHKTNFGFGMSSTLQLQAWQFKFSYENATRFPEVVELFGDGLNVVPSPAIAPEQSHNFNLGLLYNSRSESPLMISLNTFLRDARDFIIPVVQGIKVFHMNNGKVLAKGVDINIGYSYKNRWIASFNGTYLDLRNNNKWRNGEVGVENILYKVRLPNVPYLFGNVSLSYKNRNLFDGTDSYSVSISQNYVHEFFYRWENLASTDKSIVPSQFSSNLELVYSLDNERYNLSFAVNNLFDAEVFDNFQQLRPGRNYNLKLRYFFN